MRYYWAALVSAYAAWCAFWLIFGLFCFWRWDVAQDFWMTSNKANDLTGMTVANESSKYFGDWIGQSIIFGGLWPVPVVAAAVVGGFVFKRLAKV